MQTIGERWWAAPGSGEALVAAGLTGVALAWWALFAPTPARPLPVLLLAAWMVGANIAGRVARRRTRRGDLARIVANVAEWSSLVMLAFYLPMWTLDWLL